MSRMKLTLLLSLLGLLGVAGTATAQNDQFACVATNSCAANIPAIPFDLLPPGARSLGLGGAFAAVADDATAAEANPAGQTILTRPEISLHARRADYNVSFYDPNALDAQPFGAIGPGPITSYDDSNTKVSFASFVYPFERFVLSAYYQNTGALDVSSSITSFDPRFIDTYVASTVLDVEQESFGISGAFKINDVVSIGASIKYAKLEIDYITNSTVLDFSDIEFSGGVTPAQAAANALLINEVDALELAAFGDDHSLAWNLGLLVNPNGLVSFGLVYKEGGSYDVDSQLDYINIFNCGGVATCNVAPVNARTSVFSRGSEIELPDILSLGIAVRPSDTWLLSLQIDHIQYGDLPAPSATSLIFNTPAPVETISSEMSIHAGVEKTFLFESPKLGLNLLSVRAGVFSDRDHDGYSDLQSRDNHYTFGIGTVIAEDFQIDLGAELSDKVDNLVLSAVYRF